MTTTVHTPITGGHNDGIECRGHSVQAPYTLYADSRGCKYCSI